VTSHNAEIRVPPLLRITPSTGPEPETEGVAIDLLATRKDELRLLHGFAVALLISRRGRNVPVRRLRLALTADHFPATASEILVPHIACSLDAVSLIIWEQTDPQAATRAIEAPAEAIERWALRPRDLLRLAEFATDQPDASGTHLSLRWVLGNEHRVAQLLSEASVDHVSLHFSDEEAAKFADLLRSGLGLLEVSRPASIPTPGRWFASSTSMIHVSTRTTEDAVRARGSAPNHVCVTVRRSARIIDYLESAGIPYETGGSLSVAQIWIRWQSGHALEIQCLE
jgi:hypothetical protein